MAYPAHRAFLQHLKELETAIQDPGGLATSLYSHGLIDRVTKQRASLQSVSILERSRELLDKLESKIQSDESAFDIFLSTLDEDPVLKDVYDKLIASKDDRKNIHSTKNTPLFNMKNVSLKLIAAVLVLAIAVACYQWLDCYQMRLCYSKSLPSVDHFVGREEDIHNITGYLDFTTSDVQVVHIVGPPGFGKSTLAIKIGDILLRKWINIHYVDLRTVKDVDTMAEKVMLRIVEAVKNKVTLDRLEKWVREQYSKTVIVLDNCDDIIEHAKDEFLDSLADLTRASSRKNVRYIVTSQKWAADIGNFQLHSIYNLSSVAAIELLSKVAVSLTDEQKIKIAELTGNVPLALKVIGAIFRFPDAPSVTKVVQDLQHDLVATLSPNELHTKVNVSIGIAFSHLTPEMKELCVNLSHFPGSFNAHSVGSIFYFYEDLNELVSRSLLQTSHGRQRYHFHPLIKKFAITQGSWPLSHQSEFDINFLQHYSTVIFKIYNDYINGLGLKMLHEEKQNLEHAFTLLSVSKYPNCSSSIISWTYSSIKLKLLNSVFHSYEIYKISQTMLSVMESYTAKEVEKLDGFFPVYIGVVKFVAENNWPKNNHMLL